MSVRCFVVSDEFLRARGRTGTAGKTTNPTTQHRLQHRTRWARWNREGWRSQTHLSYAETPPGLQDGEHLSVAEAAIYLSGAKTNSARGKIQTHAFRGDGGAAKTHKCKYLKRSVPLHHCWLCLILWASTNNGKWDFFFFFCRSPPKKKDGKKNWQSRKHCCYLCHCDGTSKCAQRSVRKVNDRHIRLRFSECLSPARPQLEPI